MTIEEAIKNREECLEYLESIKGRANPECIEAVRWSLKALRTYAAKLDRNRWEGCPNCYRWQVCGYRNYEPAYCRDCGKPLNEEAWAELERRIGGNDEAV
jgi:hypothetical protein